MYTDEKNALLVIALLKAHGIRKVVANPGTTNIAFVGSVQNDPWFQVYSGVDERHSAYLAVGLASESGEPVVLSCTGATASRNYFSALTEAYYRKLPILALTSIHHMNGAGNLLPQMLDRTQQPNDVVRTSYQCRVPHTAEEEKDCVSNLNKAILELFRHGGGPVHINLETDRVSTFKTTELPKVRVMRRHLITDGVWPELPKSWKIAVWIGSHQPFSKEETLALDKFCKAVNAVVLKDHTSGYDGEFGVNGALLCSQEGFNSNSLCAGLLPDLVIQIGEVSGDYATLVKFYGYGDIWRVSEDGEARDLYGRLTHMFEMPEKSFFEHYAEACGGTDEGKASYLEAWRTADAEVRRKIPELPFSNLWISQKTHSRLPPGSQIHLGILNSLRSWNMWNLPANISSRCNVGGFGIDGCLSTAIGASLVHPDRLYFIALGDLSFFYDLNALGNRHIGKNLRVLLVNNGCGGEFNLYSHYGSQFGEHTNDYIAAGRHNGNKSKELVRHYAQDLGFDYLAASSKEEFDAVLERFVNPEVTQSMVLECFVDVKDESAALKMISTAFPYDASSVDKSVKDILKEHIPMRFLNAYRELVKG